MLAGKSVYLDFTHGGAIGEVIKGAALHGFGIVVDLRSSIVALCKEWNALAIGSFNQIGKAQVFAAARDPSIGKSDFSSLSPEQGCSHWNEPGFELGTGIHYGCAVQVGSGGSCGRRSIGHLISARRHNADRTFGKTQALRRNLTNLGVQALAHLSAAVVYLYTAVFIDKDERAGLIEHGCRKRDPELDRRDCKTALAMEMCRIVAANCFAAGRKTACLFQFI